MDCTEVGRMQIGFMDGNWNQLAQDGAPLAAVVVHSDSFIAGSFHSK